MAQVNSRSFVYWCGLLVISFILLVAQAHTQTGDQGWPRSIESGGLRIDVYQPQVDKWANGKLQDRTAIAVTDKNTGESTYGTAWLSGRTTLDQEKRLVTLYDIDVKNVTFPSAGTREAAYAKATKDVLERWTVTIALDRLLADIAINESEQKSGGDEFNTKPPKIFVRENSAVLILIDGDPVLENIPNSKFMRVVNSPSMIAFDPFSGSYFLRGEGYWMSAANIEGPWSSTSDTAVLAALLSSDEAKASAKVGEATPEIIVSTEPAELIEIKGEPQFSPIEGTRLLYVINTDGDVFLNLQERHYYVLLAGRWFTAPTLAGPWEFVPGSNLPLDFARIPGGHSKTAVLASIPGTPEARDAVVAAQVPQTATVDRRTATFSATYDGDPRFKKIENTEVSYAVNSSDDVLFVHGRYYAVSNGVWFVADDPRGPWAVADFVPPEIYSIPPTVPVYHVKYVYVYDSTPEYVYVGYTPGYFGSFIWNGVVVYGTGYYYPYWYGNYYLGWPWTWGFGFYYGYWGGGYYWRPWYPYPWYWHHWGGWDHHYPYYSWNRTLYNRSVAGTMNPHSFHGGSVYDRWRTAGVVSRHPVPLRSPATITPRPQLGARAGTFNTGGTRIGPYGTGTGRPGRPGGTPRWNGPNIGTTIPRTTTRDLYSDRNGQIYSHQNNGWYRNDGRNWEHVQPRTTIPGTPRGGQPGTFTPP
ncbi:MAG TPA: hypothetical protein VE783_09425, partial [Candidatus Limnocylindrales bacterium]|nr:hypothetical protein [Candidatus Limnocylindrales bacterium]